SSVDGVLPAAWPDGIYPWALRPKTVRSAVVLDPARRTARVTEVDTTYDLMRLDQGQTWFVHPSAWSSREWEQEVTINPNVHMKVHLGGIGTPSAEGALRARSGELVYDNFGNVTYAKTATRNGVVTEVVSTYELREQDWLVGLLQSEHVSSWK